MLNETNIVNRIKNYDNQFGYNIGINERNTIEKKSKLNEFNLNDMFCIKKR